MKNTLEIHMQPVAINLARLIRFCFHNRLLVVMLLLLSAGLASGITASAQNPTPTPNILPNGGARQSSSTEVLIFVLTAVGAVGTLFGAWSLYTTRKASRLQAYVLKVAELNMEKDITEDELAKRRADVELTAKRLEELRAQVRRDLPIEAKRAVLLDRLNVQMEHLTQSYHAALDTRREIEAMGEQPEISAELLRAVESEIRPGYLTRERQSRLKTYLTITTASAAVLGSSELFLSSLFPLVRIQYVTLPFLAVALIILVLLVRESIPRKSSLSVAKRGQVVGAMLLLSGGVLLFLGLITLAGWIDELRYSYRYGSSDPMGIVSIMMIVCGFALLIGPIVRSRFKRASVANRRTSGGEEQSDIGTKQ